RRAAPVSATVLPELTLESVETAERLVRLSAEEGLDSAEAEYILACGLDAFQRVSRLWLIIRARIGSGTTDVKARQLLARLLETVDKNLTLARTLKTRAQAAGGGSGRDPEARAGLDAAEDHLLKIRAEAARLLAVVDAPARWPDDERLMNARERMKAGERL